MRTEDSQGGGGAQTGHSFVLDGAQGMGLRAGEKVRFARRTARNRRWCSAEHRVIDCGVLLLFTEEFEVVIMIAVAPEQMHGSDRVPDLNDYDASLAWTRHFSSRAKWRSCASACRSVVGKQLDTTDIVRDAC